MCFIFLWHAAYFALPGALMRVFEKIRGLVIWYWYLVLVLVFSGRMENISAKEKGSKRKGCQNIAQKLFRSWFEYSH